MAAAWIWLANDCSVCRGYPEHWCTAPNALWLFDVAGRDGAWGGFNAMSVQGAVVLIPALGMPTADTISGFGRDGFSFLLFLRAAHASGHLLVKALRVFLILISLNVLDQTSRAFCMTLACMPTCLPDLDD